MTKPREQITGPAYVATGQVTSEEILGSAYLSFNPDVPEERRMLGAYALLDRQERDGVFVEPGAYTSRYPIVVAGSKFASGSARPHAAIALAAAGVRAIIACSYNESFVRTAVGSGLLLPLLSDEDLSSHVQTGQSLTIDLDRDAVHVDGDNDRTWSLAPNGMLIDIVSAGGLVPWMKSADSTY